MQPRLAVLLLWGIALIGCGAHGVGTSQAVDRGGGNGMSRDEIKGDVLSGGAQTSTDRDRTQFDTAMSRESQYEARLKEFEKSGALSGDAASGVPGDSGTRDSGAPPGLTEPFRLPPKPLPQSSLPPPPIDSLSPVDQALAALKPGRITYDPPGEMKVGIPTDIQVRIIGVASESQRDINRADLLLKDGMDRPALAPAAVRISALMRVVLSGKPEEFRIEHDSSESPVEQPVGSSEFTQWKWTVNPLKSGKRKLHLSAVAVVNIGGKETQKEYAVYDNDIDVRVNVFQSFASFIRFADNHWGQIAAASSALGITGWLVAWWTKRRSRPATSSDGKA